MHKLYLKLEKRNFVRFMRINNLFQEKILLISVNVIVVNDTISVIAVLRSNLLVYLYFNLLHIELVTEFDFTIP